MFGRLAAATVRTAARLTRQAGRPLTAPERDTLEPVFRGGLELERLRVVNPVTGLVNLSNRPFTIEFTIFVPAAYPLTPALLVHEAVHAWQFQRHGHGYITDSLLAQATNRAYRLDLALTGVWSRLNCEQQAVFVEHAFSLGAFHGKPHRLPTQLWVDCQTDLARLSDSLRQNH